MFHLQHIDRNVSPKEYEAFGTDKLLVTRIWNTIQGEGPYAGSRAIFVRLAGCNRGMKKGMGCSFCDTSFKFGDGVLMTFFEIAQRIKKLQEDSWDRTADISLVVITGGEPMLQNNLTSFCKYLYHDHALIQIESNGDRLADRFEEAPAVLVVSPKIHPSSQMYGELKPAVRSRMNFLKFLVDSRENSPYHLLPDYAFDFEPQRVFLQPLTIYKESVPTHEISSIWNDKQIDQGATAANHRYAAKLAESSGFRVSVQSHLYLDVA